MKWVVVWNELDMTALHNSSRPSNASIVIIWFFFWFSGLIPSFMLVRLVVLFNFQMLINLLSSNVSCCGCCQGYKQPVCLPACLSASGMELRLSLSAFGHIWCLHAPGSSFRCQSKVLTMIRFEPEIKVRGGTRRASTHTLFNFRIMLQLSKWNQFGITAVRSVFFFKKVGDNLPNPVYVLEIFFLNGFIFIHCLKSTNVSWLFDHLIFPLTMFKIWISKRTSSHRYN